MADDNSLKTPEVRLSSLLGAVGPTKLGMPKKDLSVKVAQVSAPHLFHVEAGKVKVPRQRKNAMVWPEWFDELDAPKMLYFWVKDSETAIPVTYNEETELFQDADGNEYTGENVREMAQPDGREIEGSPEAIQQLANAMSRFNTKTGKKLAIRFIQDIREGGATGRTVVQKRAIYRVQ